MDVCEFMGIDRSLPETWGGSTVGVVADDDVMVPVPASGRTFTQQRVVRLGDASPGGRLRFDALARMLQDIANDDAGEVLLDGQSWVVRRVAIEVHQAASFGEVLTLTTFCGGIGSRWAQRRTSILGDRGARIEVAALWVHLDMDTLRPAVLAPDFAVAYGQAAAGRTVRARLRHDDPPADASEPYRVRFVDFDVMGHMNNAAYWNAVEEQLSVRRDVRHPMRAEMEYRQGIEPHHAPRVITTSDDDGFALWFIDDATTFASSKVWRLPA
jgi:acyl-ACP thioesterase